MPRRRFTSRLAAALLAALSLGAAACGSRSIAPQPFPSPDRPVVQRPAGAFTSARGGPDFPRYLRMVAAVESGGNCLVRHAGSSAIGCYGMTRAALVDAGLKDRRGRWRDNAWGIDSDDEFRRNRRAQDAAMLQYTAKNWRVLEPCMRDVMGRKIAGVVIDQAALIAGAHLLGVHDLIRFVRCGMRTRCISRQSAEANGGARNLRALAIRRMQAVRGMRVVHAGSGSASQCAIRV